MVVNFYTENISHLVDGNVMNKQTRVEVRVIVMLVSGIYSGRCCCFDCLLSPIIVHCIHFRVGDILFKFHFRHLIRTIDLNVYPSLSFSHIFFNSQVDFFTSAPSNFAYAISARYYHIRGLCWRDLAPCVWFTRFDPTM